MADLNKSARFGDKSVPLKVSEELYEKYDYAEFVIANGISDYDVRANQSELFKNCTTAWLAHIEYNYDIGVKFNSANMQAITLGYDTSPKEFRNILKITNMFITNNSGSTVTVKVLLV